MTTTDWTAAPEWAEYLSKDEDGIRIWWAAHPVASGAHLGRWCKRSMALKHLHATSCGPNDGIMTLERRP